MSERGQGRTLPSHQHTPSAADHGIDLTVLLGLDPEATWRDSALCAQTDPDTFFPDKGGSTRPAKALCGRCEVRQQCLDYAVANEERHGIWGGLSDRERRRLRAKKTRPQAVPERPSRGGKPIEHGTPKGYMAHRRRNEDACQECLDATNTYNKRRLAERAAAPTPTPPVLAVAPPAVPEPPAEPPAEQRPARVRAWTREELAGAVALLDGLGMTAEDIAAQLGVSVRRVRAARGLRGAA